MSAIILISTYPNKKSINLISNQIIKNHLAACVNIIKISSVYFWKGKTENASEYLALFKTTSKNKPNLKKTIKETHPYDVPEIMELAVNSINQPYLKWLVESTN